MDLYSIIYKDIFKGKYILKYRNLFPLLDLFFNNESYYSKSLKKYDEDLNSIKID